jgi:hypothetical protein
MPTRLFPFLTNRSVVVFQIPLSAATGEHKLNLMVGYDFRFALTCEKSRTCVKSYMTSCATSLVKIGCGMVVEGFV